MSGIIAIDAGTTGVTCLYLDAELNVRVRAYAEFAQHFPSPGRVEHHAEELLAAVDRTLAEVVSDPLAKDAVAIGITNQRETVFACERSSGRALAPGIVWQDKRTAPECARWRAEGRGDLVRERTGLVIDPYFSGTKIHWMLREHEGLRARAERGEVVFATVDTLIVEHLTGARRWRTDATNASRTLLFDIDARGFDPDLCAWLGVDPGWLPEVLPPRSDFGRTDPARCGVALPILGTIGDQQSALLGQGAVAFGATKLTFGTGCFLLVQCGEQRPVAVQGFLTTLASDAVGDVSYALEGALFMGGALVQWLRDGLGIIADASETEALAASVPDSGGVVLAPGFTGLGAPYWDAGARGALLGLTRGTTRAHVVRAALEAIAMQNAELIELARTEGGLEVDELVVDGGAAANDLLMQMQADFCGARILRPAEVEATARGAAVLAGLGAGLWGRADQVPRPALEVFEPRLDDTERARRLDHWRESLARTLSRS
ncbi:Glycerol kinase [Planctomycetes bacterium Pla163]|uniref:ATP:glycerol 3-phosphotransferase n=1 Tax=Rohdeia mirabilis TaxID=2528008 RepID=A0A518CWX3_9BACT|nr:Glycerol kinase [Planctomycetes bacterium Pla163]